MELAYKVNALGARNLSAVARKIDARIIQISTDVAASEIINTTSAAIAGLLLKNFSTLGPLSHL